MTGRNRWLIPETTGNILNDQLLVVRMTMMDDSQSQDMNSKRCEEVGQR